MVIKIEVISPKDHELREKSLERLILTAILRKKLKTKPSLLPEDNTEERLHKTVS